MSESRSDAPSTDLPVTPVQPQTMVEKVARALYLADLSFVSQDGWAGVPDHRKQGYRSAARAAIEAMREPDEAMKAAGTERDDGADPTNAVGVYEAMIDAALERNP